MNIKIIMQILSKIIYLEQTVGRDLNFHIIRRPDYKKVLSQWGRQPFQLMLIKILKCNFVLRIKLQISTGIRINQKRPKLKDHLIIVITMI